MSGFRERGLEDRRGDNERDIFLRQRQSQAIRERTIKDKNMIREASKKKYEWAINRK